MLDLRNEKRALITGLSGQDGAYLAQLLSDKGYQVFGTIREKGQADLYGLNYLNLEKKITTIPIDLMSLPKVADLIDAIRPTEIYNLAAQSSVAESFKRPTETMQFNVKTVSNLLEAILKVDTTIRLYQASSSEMYGNATRLPIDEYTPLNPLSPYAQSKAEAHKLVQQYRNEFHIFATNGILFNHESVLRKGNFFVKKIIHDSILIKQKKKNYLEVGNIEVKRDFGYSPRYVEAMWKMLQHDTPDDYVICSGESVYLKDIILYVFKLLDIGEDKLVINPKFYRENEIYDIYGNNSKAKRELNWQYDLSFFEVLQILVEEQLEMYSADGGKII